MPECPEFTSDLGCGTFSGLYGFGAQAPVMPVVGTQLGSEFHQQRHDAQVQVRGAKLGNVGP